MRTIPLILFAMLGLSACATVPEPMPTAAHDTFGATAGATEVTEPVLQLATVDAAGELSLLDLATEKRAVVADLDGVTALTTDGRYVFAATDTGVTIVDSGAWTVPHGDHFHYYVTAAGVVGAVTGDGPVSVASDETRVVISFDRPGETVVLDREALGDGELVERGRFATAHAAVVPYGGFLLAGLTLSTVAVVDQLGSLAGAEAECAEHEGSITTRVGVVFGCADGALLATLDAGGAISFEHIPYPMTVDLTDRARDFAQRPGRPSVAAPAGSSGVWLLDTRAREWTLVASQPLDSAVAVDDVTEAIVATTSDGQVIVLDPATGDVTGTTGSLGLNAGASLHVDASRAYVNAPATGTVYEIDFADGARVAREFTLDALLLVETGR